MKKMIKNIQNSFLGSIIENSVLQAIRLSLAGSYYYSYYYTYVPVNVF